MSKKEYSNIINMNKQSNPEPKEQKIPTSIKSKNLHQSQKANNNNLMHIFTKSQILSPPISLLKSQCKKCNIPILIHDNPRQLIQLINREQQKIFIVIQSSRYTANKNSSVFPDTYSFPKIPSQNIKIISYPGYLNGTKYQLANDKEDVINSYNNYFNNKSGKSKIKLNKVSSFKDIRYQFAPSTTQTKSTYKIKVKQPQKHVFFQKILITQININPNSQYSILCESFTVPNSPQPQLAKIYKLDQIKDHIVTLKQKQKLLILIDEDNLKILFSFIQKSNINKKVQLMVFGAFKQPQKQLLTGDILLATNNAPELFQELNRIGLKDARQYKNKYQQIFMNTKNKFLIVEQPYSSNKIVTSNTSINNGLNNTPKFQRPQFYQKISDLSKNSIFSNGSLQQDRYMRNWTIEKDLKHNYIQFEEVKQQMDLQSTPMSLRASRITKKNTSSQSEASIFKVSHNLTEQHNKLNNNCNNNNNNGTNTVNIDQTKKINNNLNNLGYDIKNQIKSSNIQNNNEHDGLAKSVGNVNKILKLTKKSQKQSILGQNTSQNKLKYTMSSNIIHETSEQNRASNRQSHINMQDYYTYVQGSNINHTLNNINNQNNQIINNNIDNQMANCNNQNNFRDNIRIVNPIQTTTNKTKIDLIKEIQLQKKDIKVKPSSNDVNLLRIDSLQSLQTNNDISDIHLNNANENQQMCKQPLIINQRNNSNNVNNEKQTLPAIYQSKQNIMINTPSYQSKQAMNVQSSKLLTEQVSTKQSNPKNQNKQQKKQKISIIINDKPKNTFNQNTQPQFCNNLGYPNSIQILKTKLTKDLLYSEQTNQQNNKTNTSDNNIIKNAQSYNVANSLGYQIKTDLRRIPIVINNQDIKPYVIDGLTGEMQLQSFNRFNDNIHVPGYNSSSINKIIQKPIYQPNRSKLTEQRLKVTQQMSKVTEQRLKGTEQPIRANKDTIHNQKNTINANNVSLKHVVQVKRINTEKVAPQLISFPNNTINGYTSTGSTQKFQNIKQINQLSSSNQVFFSNPNAESWTSIELQQTNNVKSEQYNKILEQSKNRDSKDKDDTRNITTTKKINQIQTKYIDSPSYDYIAYNVNMNQTASNTNINNNINTHSNSNSNNNNNTIPLQYKKQNNNSHYTQKNEDMYIVRRYPTNQTKQPAQINHRIYTLSSPSYNNQSISSTNNNNQYIPYYNQSHTHYINQHQTQTQHYRVQPRSSSRTSNYIIQHNKNKQPEVIERIYIKASDLPDRNYPNTSNKTTYSSSSNNHTINLKPDIKYRQYQGTEKTRPYIKEYPTSTQRIRPQIREYTSTQRYQLQPSINQRDHRVKLSRQDIDPFHEKTSQLMANSQLSKQKRSSYMKRKEDGVRDPFSSYEQNNKKSNIKQINGTANQIRRETRQLYGQSRQINAGIRTYTADEYQKVLEDRQNNKKIANNTLSYMPKLPRNSQNRAFLSSPVKQDKTRPNTNIYDFNPNQFQKTVNQNGITVYTKRSNYNPVIIEKKQINSRDNKHISNNVGNDYQHAYTRYEPTGREYANSPIRKQSVSYQKNQNTKNPFIKEQRISLVKINPPPAKNQSIKPMIYNDSNPLQMAEYDSNKVYTYYSPNKHQYVRNQIIQPRVQVSNFNSRIIEAGLQDNQNSVFTTNENAGSGMDRLGETIDLSDSSIMRRNNIKFGVNKYMKNNKKMEESYFLSELKSKLKDRTVQMNSSFNKPIDIKKILSQNNDIERDMRIGNYQFIDSRANSFHFLVDQDLKYMLNQIKSSQLYTQNDKIQIFRGIDDLYNKIKSSQNDASYDAGFIFPKNQQFIKINRNHTPDGYFFVQIAQQNDNYSGLIVNSKEHEIKLAKLLHLQTVKKILLQSKLTNVILCMRSNIIEQKKYNDRAKSIMDLFPSFKQQFIKEYFDDGDFKVQNILNFIWDDPVLNRFYIICNEKELPNIQTVLIQLKDIYSATQQIFKIICLTQTEEYNRDEIKSYRNKQMDVVLFPNSVGINDNSYDYKQLLNTLTSSSNNKQNKRSENSRIYYDERFMNLVNEIEKQFPSRFQFLPFKSINQVHKKLTLQLKNDSPTKFDYLIIHPLMCDEHVEVNLFKKTFMLGKSQQIQKYVTRVNSQVELIQLLRN